jgi:spore coat protein U-like protein
VIRIAKYLSFLFSWFSFASAFAACTVTTTGINFGNYDVFNTSPLNSTGSVTVSCDSSPPPDVTISIGQSPTSGGFIPRKMKNTILADTLSYNVYQDAAGTLIWGDGTGGTSTVYLKNVKKNRPVITTIYAIVPPQQNVSIGTYSDLLTVTIVW